MLTRIHGDIVFECDECGEALETETDDFGDAQRKFRGQDWKARKVGDDWHHYCPECWS